MKRHSLYFLSVIILAFTVIGIGGCKKNEDSSKAAPETGTMTDIDGNVYQTVKIGNQWWMAENLKVTRYTNGDSVTHLDGGGFKSDTLTWQQDTIGAYSIYDNNSNNVAPGYLYNWYAATNTRKLAPAGWHIPSDAEWKTLEMTVGMSSADADKFDWRGTDEGDKLRMASPTGWSVYGDVWNNNESGFSALAGSCIVFNGKVGFPGIHYTGFWWSSSMNLSGSSACYRYLDYKNHNVFRSYCDRHYGYSIRCVKD